MECAFQLLVSLIDAHFIRFARFHLPRVFVETITLPHAMLIQQYPYRFALALDYVNVNISPFFPFALAAALCLLTFVAPFNGCTWEQTPTPTTTIKKVAAIKCSGIG